MTRRIYRCKGQRVRCRAGASGASLGSDEAWWDFGQLRCRSWLSLHRPRWRIKPQKIILTTLNLMELAPMGGKLI